MYKAHCNGKPLRQDLLGMGRSPGQGGLDRKQCRGTTTHRDKSVEIYDR